jgi:hypothetical protein
MEGKIAYPLQTRLTGLIGRKLEEGVRLIEGEGLLWRIVVFDNKPKGHEQLNQMNDRVNLEVLGGKIVEAKVY